jgi:Uma2 family endonuclease
MYQRAKRHFTPEQYLAMEDTADYKSEYFQGEIFVMAGASSNHNLIAGNVYAALHQSLRNKPCLVYTSDMRLLVKKNGLFTYPDVTVVCGRPQFFENRTDTVANPILVVEVLSESTKDYDRGFKFELYRALETLREYVLIDQSKVHVEHYQRLDDGRWLLQEFDRAEDTLQLLSVEFKIRLSEIYEKVDFATER